MRATKLAQIFRVTFFFHKLQIYAKKTFGRKHRLLPFPHYIRCTLELKIWHGEPDIATYSFIGGYRPELGSFNAMFDNELGENSMYHSIACSGDRGVVINFVSMVQYQDVVLHTRRLGCSAPYYCRARYTNVCLYADEVKVSCTPSEFSSNFQRDAPPVISFKDYNFEVAPIIASQYRIMFEDTGDNMCGQIEELFVHYLDTRLSSQELSDGRTIWYVRSKKTMSYIEANSWCTQQNGNLPVPASQEENNFLAEIGSTWLAVNAQNFQSMAYTNWACIPKGCEPSGDGPLVQLIVGERWGHDWGHGGWNDIIGSDSFATCYLTLKGEILLVLSII